MNRTALPFAAAVFLLLSACSALPLTVDEPTPTPATTVAAELQPGDCLQSFDGTDSDRTSVIACTEPHAFDVVGFALWPGMDPAIAAADARDVFDALTEEPSDLGSEYFAWATATCARLLREATGVDSLAIGDVTGNDVQLLPGGSFNLDLSLANHGKFVLEKDHRTLCSVAWLDAEGQPAEVAWPAGVDIRSILTASMPTEAHYCYVIGKDQTTQNQIDCDEPHVGERTAQIALGAALGPGLVSSVTSTGGSDTDWAAIDAFCATVNNAVVPGGVDPTTWTSWSNLAGSYGDDDYLVSCQVRSIDDELVTTDLFAPAP
jgi:hypothetical protein